MSSTRVGTNKKYSENWDNIFGGKKASRGKPAAAKAKKSAKKMAGNKKTAARRKKRGR
jgi:hypothetical protein